MKIISPSIKKLLDKLYNLKGKDSIILEKMTSDKKQAEEIHEKACALKNEIENNISTLTNKLNLLDTKGTKLEASFKEIKEENYNDVISLLGMDLDINALHENLVKALPLNFNKLKEELISENEKLTNASSAIDEALTNIADLDLRISDALKDQEQLNNYLNMALDSNMNITRDEITALLEKLGFDTDEQKEVAKLLMFPEDGLFAYNENPNQIVAQEDKSQVISEPIKEETVVEPKEETNKETISFDEVVINNLEAPAKEEKEDFVKEENNETITKESLVELLNELGFDYLDFTANDFNNMLANFDEELFKRNVLLFKNVGIHKDVFLDNIALFYDKDVDKKVDKLVSIGKSAQDIYLNPDVLMKYDFAGLENAIKVLENSGLDPKHVPLMAY